MEPRWIELDRHLGAHSPDHAATYLDHGLGVEPNRAGDGVAYGWGHLVGSDPIAKAGRAYVPKRGRHVERHRHGKTRSGPPLPA